MKSSLRIRSSKDTENNSTYNCQGGGAVEEGWTRSLGLVAVDLLHMEGINNKVLLYSKGNIFHILR